MVNQDQVSGAIRSYIAESTSGVADLLTATEVQQWIYENEKNIPHNIRLLFGRLHNMLIANGVYRNED